MSWRDRLLPASYKGVLFEVESAERAGLGRKIVVEEYPERDTPGFQDLGRGVRRLTFSAFVCGDDYDVKRDALIDAFESEGPGELVHPYYGRLWGSVTDDSSVIDAAMDGGVARFSIAFVVRAEIDRSTSGLEEAQTTGTVSARAAAAVAQSVADSAARDAEVALVPIGLRRLYTAAQATESAALSAVLGLDEVGDDIAAEVYATVVTYDAARTIAGWAFPAIVGANPPITAAWLAWQRLWTTPALRRACEISVSSPFAVAEDATARAAEIVTLITAIEAQAAPHDLLASLRALRASTVAILLETATTLPRLVEVDVPTPTPAFVLAFDRWGDPARDVDILARNEIAHPGFVAGRLTVPT